MSLVHVPTQSGLVNPAAEVGRLCREAGVLFVLDACQSAGQLPLDVDRARVRRAHRQRPQVPPRARAAPGFLYMHQALLEQVEPVMLDMHAATWVAPDRYEMRADARRFEMWEHDVAARIGLGVAVDHALELGHRRHRRAQRPPGRRPARRLAAIPGVTVHDAASSCAPSPPSRSTASTRRRSRPACEPSAINVSVERGHVSPARPPHRGLDAVVRASVHYVTTDAELDRFAEPASARIACAPAS